MPRVEHLFVPRKTLTPGGDMGERVLRGKIGGATSRETDRNTDLAPRREAVYDCPHGHSFGVRLSSEAEVPPTWDCRSCGATALLRDARVEHLFVPRKTLTPGGDMGERVLRG